MFPSTNVSDLSLGDVRIKRNPLSSGLSRAAFAKERIKQMRLAGEGGGDALGNTSSNSGRKTTTKMTTKTSTSAVPHELEMTEVTVRPSTRTEVSDDNTDGNEAGIKEVEELL